MNTQPSLFGLNYSNRDFTRKKSWGKNQFNSSFPAALTAYLHSKDLDCIYLVLNENLKVEHQQLSVDEFFGTSPTSDDIFYAFEAPYAPYQQLVIGKLPRVDLVTQSRTDGSCLAPIEIKLTALPDHTTCNLEENKYGSEIVVRPDTIVYLACSIAQKLNSVEVKKLDWSIYEKLEDWTDASKIIPLLGSMVDNLNTICVSMKKHQTPLVLQPVWKTEGKSPVLADNCLDCFVWSNLAFTRLFVDTTLYEIKSKRKNISRNSRTLVWLFKMLYDFIHFGQFDHHQIIDQLSYNTKNDKAFALNGKVTHKYMDCAALTKPRIRKQEIKNIVLGGGQELLSPERRFDAIIYNDSKLFY